MTNTIKWIVWALLIITVSYTLYYSFTEYFKNTTNKENTVANEPIKATEGEKVSKELENELEKELSLYNKLEKDSSLKNQEEYLEHLNKILSRSDLSTDTRNSFTLKRLAIMALVRNSSPDNTIAVNNDLKPFILMTPKSESDSYMKDYAIVVFLKLNFQNRSFNDVKRILPEIFEKHKKKNYNDEIATLLSLIEVADTVSEKRKNDNSLSSAYLVIESEILNYFLNNDKEKLTPEDLQMILSSLKSNVANFNQTEALTYHNEYHTKVEGPLYYAYGYDLYTTYANKTLSKQINQNIDKNYEDAHEIIEEYSSNNKTATSMMYTYNSVRYLTSLDRRYGTNIDKAKVDKIVTKTLTAINYSPDTKNVTGRYIKQNYYSHNNKNWSYFISLGKTRDDVNELLKSYGIDIRK